MNITVETLVAATIERVWQAYTTPEDIVQWNAASDDWHTTRAQVDLREGAYSAQEWKLRTGVLASILKVFTPVLFH